MVLPSGHFAAVEDVKWDPAGQYLISCSADQTTRLFAAWNRGESFETTYHEIARPQIHGYAMQCIATISSACFVSGGEEKILRVFSAPKGFVQNFQRICAVDDSIMKQVLHLPKAKACNSKACAYIFKANSPNMHLQYIRDFLLNENF